MRTQKATGEIIRDLNVIYAEKGIKNQRYTGRPLHHSLYNDEIQEPLSFPDLCQVFTLRTKFVRFYCTELTNSNLDINIWIPSSLFKLVSV